MKKYSFLTLIIITLVLSSCVRDEDEPYHGFVFDFWNYTDEVYDAELVIGGYKNGTFIPTDSILIHQIQKGEGKLFYFSEENRWKPNLDRIRNIPSERCYFKLKLTPQRQEMIIRSGQTDILGLKLPSRRHFKGDFGKLIIGIRDTEITGYTPQEL
ncbi:MAG: hypothetical protein HWD85_01620 [Flavobacteriaceae bacterium]|nr:hypothetical protein [Flavobacteriaceae bacterium]